MASVIPFDTHAYVRKLVAAGVSEPQAEAHASALAEMVGQLATKQDLELLRQEVRAGLLATKQDMELLRQELKADMQLLRQEVRAEIQALRLEVRSEIQALRTEMKELELRIAERLRSQMLWFFAVQFTLLGIAVAIIKLVP